MLGSQINFRTLESAALRDTQEFITPKTRLEQLGTLLGVLWLLTALLPLDQTLRAIFFLGMILLIFLAVLQKLISPEKGGAGQGFAQAGIRTFLFFIPIEFFGQGTKNILEDWSGIDLTYLEITTYGELEQWGVLLLLVGGLFATSLDRELLKQYKFVDFVLLLFRGVFSASLVLFCFISMKFVDIEFSANVLFLASLLGYIISGMGPSRLGLMELATAGTLPILPQSSRTEGLRDSLILGALMILLFKFALSWLEGPYWIETAVLLIAAGIFVQIVLLQQGLNPLAFLGGQQLFKQRLNLVGNSLQQFQEELVKDSPDLTQRTVLSAADDIPLLKRANETISVMKDGIILPLAENEDETTLMVLGKGNVKTETAESEDQDFEGTTTLTIPRNEWEEIKTSKALIPSSLSDETLARVGSSKNELSNQIGNSLTQLKKFSLSRKSLSSLVPDMSRYGVQDTVKGTSVSLPGLKVIDQKGLTYVKLPFLEVMDSRFGDLVSLPFLKVLDTKEIDVVHSPLFSVITTKKGSIVKILGFTIREGDLDDVELQKTIRESLSRFAADKEQLGLLGDVGSSLLLTTSADGPKMRLLPGDRPTISSKKPLPAIPEVVSSEIKEEFTILEEPKTRSVEKVTPEPQIHPTMEQVSQEGESITAMVCELCNEPIVTVGTACPFCGREFHKEHWQAWIQKRGNCPVCGKNISKSPRA